MYKTKTNVDVYTELLREYINGANTEDLMNADTMSKLLVEQKVLPEEIIKIHIEAIEKLHGSISEEYIKSLLFLFDAMFAYRNAHEEFAVMKEAQLELKSEIEVAANMQSVLLATEKPKIDCVDIGTISVPYQQLNGDYHHFVQGEGNSVGIAIADVIGKGFPAALSMSMIKYAMDSFYEETMSPQGILRQLNRVVERNVASNMFITMLYGQYFPNTSRFRYASAGHEPGFIYRAKDDSFMEMETSGVVLGVLPDTIYKQFEVTLEKDDMVILLTDGVTECRRGERFITREEVIDVIKMFAHLPAQEHVEAVYDHFFQLDDFELKDDFTLIIIKKVV